MTRAAGSSGAVLATRPTGRPRLDPGELSVGVVGGGIAGVAAACVLAERGARVIVYERERWLGGRAGAWTDELAGVGRFEMERGFHAFFRQYYNLRALIRRVDPALALLAPLDDYPILGPARAASFAGLSRRWPVTLVQLVARTESLGLRALARVDLRAALAMLRFDVETTYAEYDRITARQYLDGLGFPAPARRMLFDVFAHSFGPASARSMSRYPETRGARIVAERYLQRRDCPAFAAGSWTSRPGVATDIDGLALAGDFVKLAMPSALMERAATSGMLAANLLLARRGVAGEPIWSVPPRGALARPILRRRRGRAAGCADRWQP